MREKVVAPSLPAPTPAACEDLHLRLGASVVLQLAATALKLDGKLEAKTVASNVLLHCTLGDVHSIALMHPSDLWLVRQLHELSCGNVPPS